MDNNIAAARAIRIAMEQQNRLQRHQQLPSEAGINIVDIDDNATTAVYSDECHEEQEIANGYSSDVVETAYITRSEGNECHNSPEKEIRVISSVQKSEETSSPIPELKIDIEIAGVSVDEALGVLDAVRMNSDDADTAAIKLIRRVFGNATVLSRSFWLTSYVPTLECPVDIDGLRKFYTTLRCLGRDDLESILCEEISALLDTQLELMRIDARDPCASMRDILCKWIVVLENPGLLDSEYREDATPVMCTLLASMKTDEQEMLIEWWVKRSDLRPLIACFQHVITMRLLEGASPHEDSAIKTATAALSLVWRANNIISKVSPVRLGLSDFYNECLNDVLDIRRDFSNWKAGRGNGHQSEEYSFCRCGPFLLNAETKSRVLESENAVHMRMELQDAMLRSLFGAVPDSPFLIIKVRREHFIRDALFQLARRPSRDLRKQLKVIFHGEEGIDEGGVAKEFFSMVVGDLFAPQYGMFVEDPDTRLCLISPDSFETDAEFELVGIVFGLAIYNGHILDVHLPLIYYYFLLREPSKPEKPKFVLGDIKQSHPAIWRGLRDILAYDPASNNNASIEDVFCLTFSVDRVVFGTTTSFPLRDGGSDIPVTMSNREEYVSLYVEYLLYESIALQLRAFKRGFDRFRVGHAMGLLQSEELERLVCGETEYDFDELRSVTSYIGYKADDRVVGDFWSVFDELSNSEKRRLLAFVSGSDRVPIGGVSKLKFIIQKCTDDTDRLPASHTCFGVLDLPNYPNKQKLKERLLFAIYHGCEGFHLI